MSQTEREPWILTLVGTGVCVGWLANYLGMIRKSLQDRTYGMALLPLCCNIAFEFVYLLYPPKIANSPVVFACWLALNLPVVFTAIRFAPNEWGHAPLVQRNLPWIFAVSIVGWMTAHLALIAQLGPTAAASWSAWFCQLFLSAGSLYQLMVRGSSRGTSLFIWFSRFLASALVLPYEILRYKHGDPNVVWHSPLGWWGGGAFFVLDISYGFLLWKIIQSERTQVNTLGKRSD